MTYISELDLDAETFKEKTRNSGWAQNFLLRYNHQRQKRELTHKEICNIATHQKHHLLSPEYELTPNALSQYTNIKGKNYRNMNNIEALIAISSVLNVSIDYLLGIEEKETHEITNIYKSTGLDYTAINLLKNNRHFQHLILSLSHSKHIEVFLDELNKIYWAEYFYESVFYDMGTFKEQIENIFLHFYTISFAFDKNKEKYIEYLHKELSIPYMKDDSKNTKDFLLYLKDNISESLLLHIISCIDEHDSKQQVFSVFVDYIADFTFDILMQKQTEKLTYYKLLEMFIEMCNFHPI